MAMHIYPKEIGGGTYYYAHRTFREKIKADDSGKTKGSGSSRVRSETIYLGTAESIVEKVKGTRTPQIRR